MADWISTLIGMIPIIRDYLLRLDVDVRSVYYQDYSGDTAIRVAGKPTRYRAEVQITNGHLARVGIKKVCLIADGLHHEWDGDEIPTLELGDVRNFNFTFSTNGLVTPGKKYVLEIVDSRGSKVTRKGAVESSDR